MIVRNGFVSNSSSSSFIVLCKGDLKENLRKYFDEIFKELIEKIKEDILDSFYNSCERIRMFDREYDD